MKRLAAAFIIFIISLQVFAQKKNDPIVTPALINDLRKTDPKFADMLAETLPKQPKKSDTSINASSEYNLLI